MSSYATIRNILDRAVDGDDIGAHGAFWRGQTRDQFVAHVVFGFPLVEVGNGAGSNLVKALRGESPFDGSGFRRMPAGRDPVPDEEIATVEKWIDDGCPEEATDADTGEAGAAGGEDPSDGEEGGYPPA
ncbi:MAG: hypothetical protein MI919_21335 [Holophagales bacterium]|nr:hypothetical protein [Holophagales bacterium]